MTETPPWLGENFTHPVPKRQIGDVVLAVNLALSALLVVQQFGAVSLPGSIHPPDREGLVSLARIVNLPISYFFLIFLAGVACRWLMARNVGISTLFRWTIRFAAAASASYLVMMLREEFHCPYTGALLALNLVFWLVAELAQPALHQSLAALVTMLAGSAVASSFLYLAVAEANREIPGQEQVSPQQVAAHPDKSPEQRHAGDEDQNGVPSEARAPDAIAHDTDSASTKRVPFQRGAREATVQVLAFYDYESPSTVTVDERIQAIVDKYQEIVSLTVMHYPLCRDCNFSVKETKHPHACTAAQAAEAAGILGGPDLFWKVHRWLCQQRGKVTEQLIAENAPLLGITDTDRFLATMKSAEVLTAILSDTVDGQTRGVSTSPTLFINNERLVGPNPELEILRAVALASGLNEETGGPIAATTAPIETAFADGFPRDVQLAAILATLRVSNSTNAMTGSGVIVAAKKPFVYAITAQHIVGSARSLKVQTFSEDSYPKASEEFVATVLATSATADLALIRYVSASVSPRPLPIAGERTYVNNSFLAFSAGCSDASPPTCVSDNVTRRLQVRREDRTIATMWETQNGSTVGRSGGPLLDERGSIVGIASGVSEGKGYYTHLSAIHRFVSVNGLKVGQN